jgi:CheY-like chemotaxis protein
VLSIKEYDAAEAAAMTRAAYPAIRAFTPAAFAMVNFPTRVREEAELIRYADIMYELADRELWYRKTPYSPAEAATMASLSDSIEGLTASAFGRPVRPFMCLFPPIPIWRTVTALAQRRPLRVFEIGGGAGYLGAYLISSGHSYTATDNTQALYLWQNRWFSTLAKDDFVDFAATPGAPAARVTMMPWWDFAQLFREPPDVDIIVCDAAMGEMDPFAVNYITRLAARMLARSSVGAFLFSNIGEQRVSSMDYVRSRFAKAGFHATELGPVIAHSLKPLSLVGAAPPVGAGALKPAAEFLPIDSGKLLDAYAFFDFIQLHS